MFVINEGAFLRDGVKRALDGRPSSLVELVQAEKVVDLAAARARLRSAPKIAKLSDPSPD
jgi:hypothetical protein